MSRRQRTWALKFLVIYCVCLAPLWGGETPAEVTVKARIGTYDSRAVAVAYAASEQHQKLMKEKMQQLKAAQASGDTKRVKELKTWGEGQQRLMHMQGFAGAPVDDILAQVQERLPAVAKDVGVDALTRQVDYSAPDVQTIDVTDAIVKLFDPSEKTLKTIAEVRRHVPAKLEDVAVMKDRE
jgi:hypothetical protein